MGRSMITKETLSAIADAVVEAIDKIPNSKERGEKVCMGADGTPTSQIDKVAENAASAMAERVSFVIMLRPIALPVYCLCARARAVRA